MCNRVRELLCVLSFHIFLNIRLQPIDYTGMQNFLTNVMLSLRGLGLFRKGETKV